MKNSRREIIILSSVVILSAGLLYTAFLLQIPLSVQAYYTSPTTQVATVTLTVNKEIEITSISTSALLPAIYGITGNPGSPAVATATFNIITNDVGGYSVTVTGSGANSLVNGADATAYFTDYSASTTLNWKAATAGTSEFGYSVIPAAANTWVAAMKNNSSVCGTGSTQTSLACWVGLTGSAFTILTNATASAVAGDAETINFKAEFNPNASTFMKSGSYQSVVTITATAT